MTDIEEYFPRGGKKPTTTNFKQTGNFLDGAIKEDKKKKKSKKKSEEDDGYLSDEVTREVDQSYKTCGLTLHYGVIKEGYLMLGRVRETMETKLYISLPCRMQGVVMACHISETYNKLLEDYVNDKIDEVPDLSSMFKLGQYVVVKVLEVLPRQLMLSMMPQHINSGKNHADLHKGALLQAAVTSVEDHGYLMDIGIPNTKVFLPKKSCNPDVELVAGALTWCTVKSIKSSSESPVLTVSNELEALQHAFQRNATNVIVPGTALEFVVDKPLDNGIEGHVFGDKAAYIQRHQADSVKGKKPNLGQKIRARLLYVIPPKNIPFLTMKNIFESTYPNLEEEQKLQDGDIVEDAQVIKITGRSIHFKLGKYGSGLLSVRRIQVDEDLGDEEVVAKSYPIGSKHKVRVLCYHLSDHTYSVSDEASVLAEKWFRLSQVAVGDQLPAVVTEVADTHLRLNVGRLKAYVPQIHMTDSGIFVDPKKASTSKLPKKKFKVGQEVKGRVLSVDMTKKNLVLTLKPSLLDPSIEVLQSYEQAVVGKAYTGVIGQIRNYLLVSFFNNVLAFVPRQMVAAEPIDNLADAFHLGQIVKCTILTVNASSKKMSGSLKTAPFTPTDKGKTNKRKNEEDLKLKAKKSKLENKENEDEATTESDTDVEDENITTNKKKDKKLKETLKGDSEESDAIETDVQEDQILTPQDLFLMDITDCDSPKSWKKRGVSLLKAIQARTKRLERIEAKIQNIEERGLHSKNKKFHTAMHTEKLTIEERILKLKETLDVVQEKLKELDIELNKDYKKKKEKSVKDKSNSEKKQKKESKVKEKSEFEIKKKPGPKSKRKAKSQVQENDEHKDTENVESIVHKDNDKNATQKKVKKKDKIKNIETDIVEDLQPVVVVPSAKEFWSADPVSLANKVQEESSSSSEEEEEEKPKKKRKKLTAAEKVAKAREEEEKLREMEKRAIESESQPRSTEQFQRALLASPDCSQLWIAYMAFHLQATEIDKARAVARKALSTINFREETERLNVWLALLNLEHRFGTKESQQKTLEDAVQMNDSYKVYAKLLDILVDTGKLQELSGAVELMLRKFRRDEAAYRECGAACYRAGLTDKARYVMQKGMAALEKKQHVSLLVQFANLERKWGERERSEALFEQVLAVYPARVDVAAAYTDTLLKAGDVSRVRQVMERLTANKLPARKMKVLYKKWLEVEEKIGDNAHVESVRQRAIDYLDKAMF